MLKMYHKQKFAADTSDFWESDWEPRFEDSLKFCAVDPLRPLFEKYLRPDSLLLEGGCGSGQYLAYYAARGYRVIGLDFNQKALNSLHKIQPHLSLTGGDVARMPFADKSFDLYYSGGVVEHFEKGPQEALSEAWRVLKDDGVLLISVPYFSPLRRVLLSLRRNEWRKVKESRVEDGVFDGKTFFQYAYSTAEFKEILENAGFRVTSNQGYAVLWGLSEVSPSDEQDVPSSPPVTPDRELTSAEVEKIIKDKPMSLIKRLVVKEDATIPLLGLGVKFMRWASANMMMFVCVKKDAGIL